MAFSSSKPQAQVDQKNAQAVLRAMENDREDNHFVFSNEQRPFATKKDEKSTPKKTGVSHTVLRRNHKIEASGEAMSVQLPDVDTILLDYLDADLIIYYQGDKITQKFSPKQRQQFTLFGAKPKALMYEVGSEEAASVANLILRGEEKEVNEALALVKKNPDLLRTQCIATDPLGRRVAGTPFQIAAMAGDVNLLEGEIKEEKNRGLVERLKAVAGLSDEEVREQLEEVFASNEAIAENEKRNQRILDAIKAFGEKVIKASEKYKGNDFEELQVLCQPVIKQLESDLTLHPNEVIKSGTIFDLTILQKAEEWFEENVNRFGDWWSIQSDVFWVNGVGKLQSQLSSRDARVIRAGIGDLVDYNKVPTRLLRNSDGASYFYNTSSHLGQDIYLGYYGGECGAGMWTGASLGRAVGKLMSSKKNSVAKLMRQDNSKQSRCLIM